MDWLDEKYDVKTSDLPIVGNNPSQPLQTPAPQPSFYQQYKTEIFFGATVVLMLSVIVLVLKRTKTVARSS